MNILMTGAGGYLGTSLSASLESAGHRVVRLNSKNCDLNHADSLDPWSLDRFDRIYHLAAWTQAGDFCLHHPGEQWIINQRINTNVLAWWQKSQPQAKLVCMGTSCAYPADLEMEESNYLVGIPEPSLYTYAMTKRMLYVGLLALEKQFGLRHLCLVPSTLYGPGYHTDGRQMHFIFDLIRKILRAKLYQEPVVLWGDGHQRRELVYLDDFIHVATQLDETVENQIVNIGAGSDHSIREFAGIISRLAGYDAGQIQYDTSRYVGARSKCLNTQKLLQLQPDWRQISLEDGLEQTIQWFLREREVLLRPGA